MTTQYSPLLGLALPVTGELSGTWCDVVNDSITSLVEASIAGFATADVTSGNWTLTTTGSGAANQARMMILRPTGNPGVPRNIIAPSSSKIYVVINTSDDVVVLKGSATTGVEIQSYVAAVCAWDGADFTVVSDVTGPASATDTAVATYDGSTGKIIKNTGVLIDGSNNVTIPGQADLRLSDADSSNWVAFQAASIIPANITWTLPSTDGTATQVLSTNGTGTLSWTSIVPGVDNIGYQNVPQNIQSSNYTLALSDSGKQIFHPASDTTARTWTIPANSSVAFPIGTAVSFITDAGSGAITIAITSDTLIAAGTGLTGNRTLATSSIATAIKITSTKWIISGNSLT